MNPKLSLIPPLPGDPVKFSMVVATLNRSAEAERLLESLCRQSHRDFEVLVVDQNADDRIERICLRFSERLDLRHLRSAPGASRARNVGLPLCRGDVIGFPDDDCWYPADLLERVERFFRSRPEVDGLAGRTIARDGSTSTARFSPGKGAVTRYNVWNRAVTAATFLRREVVVAVGEFDPALGVGAPFGSGEDTDYPLRALAAGFRILYDPAVAVYHEEPVTRYDEAALRRARSYALGMGRVLRKHRYPPWFLAYTWLRPLGGAALALSSGRFRKARYHFSVCAGRASGWFRSAEARKGAHG